MKKAMTLLRSAEKHQGQVDAALDELLKMDADDFWAEIKARDI